MGLFLEELVSPPSRLLVPVASDAVCVTLYNEPLDVLESTLSSLVQSAARAHGVGKLHSLCVCLLADGAEKQDPAVSAWLDTLATSPLGLVNPSVQRWTSQSLQSARRWSSDAPWGWMVHFIVCRKPINCGKLHSHAMFFGDICPLLRPARCWQIDVGTRVAPSAMGEMIDLFAADSLVGAVGSRVELPIPVAISTYIQRWQYMDFAIQAAGLWPAEAATGYMSVVPGQFCAFRWEAMSLGGAEAPVHQYLRGMQPRSRMERIMFLAEDRVIGNELVLARGRPWRLAYGHRAGAVTDACATLSELMRQRRRWHNSSFACRLWLLAHWPKQMLRQDRDAMHKLSFSLSMLWQSLLAAVQCLTPALTIAGLVSLVASLLTHAAAGSSMLSIATSVVITLAVWGALRPGQGGGRWGNLSRDACSTVALLLYCMVLHGLGGLSLVVCLMGPTLVSAVLPVMVLPGRRLHVLRYVPEYWLLHSVCQTVLWFYAVRHIGDTSWGTKGLVAPMGRPRPPTPRGSAPYEATVLGISCLANAGVLAACGWTGLADLPAGLVVASGSVVLAVTLLAAVVGHVRLEWLRRYGVPHDEVLGSAIRSEMKEQNA